MNKRKFTWRRFVCGLFASLLVVTAFPEETKADLYWPEGPSIVTPSAVVMEVNSGAVLYEKNMDQVNYPASITKILTVLLALEHCELDEVVTFSDDAINLNQGDTSHIARDYGEKMTMEECLYAVMLESANECAYAVAEHVGEKLGGDYQSFVKLMNKKAKELGCKNTNFANANGLPDENHWTSAHDMALISATAYKNESFRIIAATKAYQIPPTNKHKEITYLGNHHKMLHARGTAEYVYPYCTGGKTGYTQAAGSTLVTFAEKDGLSLVCVVMHTESHPAYTDTRNMMDYCFKNFQAVDISEDESTILGELISKGILNTHESYVKLENKGYIVLPMAADTRKVETSLVTKGMTGNIIAKIQYLYDDRVVGSVHVVPAEGAKIDNYFELYENKDSSVNLIKIKPSTLAIIIILLILAIVGGIFGKKLYDNFYVIKHDFIVRRDRQSRFKPISTKKKKWRKRDSMFR